MNDVSCRQCNQENQLVVDFHEIEHNERRTLWVVVLTLVMMVFEVAAGYWTGSMALLADGYHMASHAGALGIALVVYKLAKSKTLQGKLNFGTGKLLPLGGYTSAIVLGMIALWMAVESIARLLAPTPIEFNEAIAVAVIGLLVNLLSAWILGGGHSYDDHHHNHPTVEDHNHKSALAHVLADALTSVLAIVALLAGKYYMTNWLDPLIGIVGAVVILRWAYSLCRETAWDLLDGDSRSFPLKAFRDAIENAGHQVLDLHAWKVGPGNHAVQLIVHSSKHMGSSYFRSLLPAKMESVHLVVEER